MARRRAGGKPAMLAHAARALEIVTKHRIDKLLRRSIPVGRDVMHDQLWRNIGNAIRSDHMDFAIAICPAAEFTRVKAPHRILDVSRKQAELPQKSPGSVPGLERVTVLQPANVPTCRYWVGQFNRAWR